MCVELVSQCDWCLFRRHVTWHQCRNFRKLSYKHVKEQDFPLPTPENCDWTIKDAKEGKSFLKTIVIVKIRLGRCPAPVCLSEIFAAIERKKMARIEERRRIERHLRKLLTERIKTLWVWAHCVRVPINMPSTESLLTLGFLEEEEEDEWEDASEFDEDSTDWELEGGDNQEQATPSSLEGLGQGHGEQDKAGEQNDE